jgi:hypothetical protein
MWYGKVAHQARANYGAAVDRREDNGSGLDGEQREAEEDLRSKPRRRSSGANGVTPVSGVPASRTSEAPAARGQRSAESPPPEAPREPATQRDPVPARDPAPQRDPRTLPASPLHEALRGSRSTELPRVESPRPPRQPAADSLRDPLPGDFGDFGDFTAPTEASPALHDATSVVDASALRASIKQNDGLYRSTKPAFAVLYGLLASVGELLMLRPFLAAAFKIAAGAALAPLLAMIAFPFLAMGLYGISTGAATAVQFQGPRVWLRTPLVYVPVALLLLIAAGTAA